MSLSAPAVRRVIVAGAFTGAMFFGSASVAVAEPPPPGCTAGDLARVASGVSNATADYLFIRPDVNAFFTGLKGQDEETLRANTEKYLDANPQVRTDLQNIRQPLVEFRARCQ